MGEENQSYANERKTKQCHYSSEREKKDCNHGENIRSWYQLER